RLNRQHDIIVRAFDDRLSVAPISLRNGDRVLESAAGSGIWALEFFEKNHVNGILIDMECIDISSKQFPHTHPPEMHFSVNTITDLPPEWTNTFSYVHQRLLVTAMTDSLWRSAIAEISRVVQPGGWVEFLEIDFEYLRWGVGPQSKKLTTLVRNMCTQKGMVRDMSVYLPALLEDAGFLDVQCVTQHVSIGGELNYSGNGQWRNLCLGMKGPIVQAGGYGIVQSGEEYKALLEASSLEWKTSGETNTSFYAITARKPCESLY
ncbi:S-adenosyl-L-methionine-dependent methyltransferase, partial [Lentinula edodes]|uniref:S-adenosyl-L-methionine-dependent methyltransferase n=1 Tax=Lentinula edodes TaxID=5353 RepID=UPI001E8DC3B1